MTKLTVNPEYEALWGQLPRSEYAALKDTIRVDGLLEKIVVNPELVILDGHQRHRVLQDLKMEVTREHYVIRDFGSREGELLYILRTQINRRHATPFKRVENALPLLEIMRTKAAAARTSNLPGQPNGQFSRLGRVRDQIAEIVGLSGRTVEKTLYIIEHGDEEFKAKLRMNPRPSIDLAYRQVREVVEPKPAPQLPDGVFDVIYADPPWDYYYKLRGAPDDHYPTMKTEDICDLEIPAADDAVLFLWATNPKLEDALTVIKAWGFDYKTNRVWVKDIWGTGYYFRGQHELLLLATRGDMGPPPMATRLSSVLHAPRGNHSEKPGEIYDMIEAMYPGHTYLELFSRNEREGWEMWGHDTR
jgi:N6-adenosine-specific RNA methylase IME4